MYEWNECFPQPPLMNSKVWRYMDFTKLVSLLDTGKLFFPRVDKLDDPYEGTSPKALIDAREKMLAQIAEDPQYDGNTAKRAEILDSYRDVAKTLEKFSQFMAVSCWHLNESESMAMWKLYLSANEGVALQTTYERLRNCFRVAEEKVHIGLVTYIDYDNDEFSTLNMDYLYVHKRKSFEHEREIRCLVRKYPEHWTDEPLIGAGIAVPVDLDLLIENIYVAPASPPWFLDVVNSTIQKFGRKEIAVKSPLSKPPTY